MTRLGPKQRAILEALNDQDWIPGRELAERINVPAHIVWSYVERLRDRGFEITGDKRGYRLVTA